MSQILARYNLALALLLSISMNGSEEEEKKETPHRSGPEPPSGIEHRASAILHDLRGVLELIKDDSKEAERLNRSKNPELRQALSRLCGTIDYANAISYPVPEGWERTNLFQLLSTMTPILRRSTPDSAPLEIEVEPEAQVSLWVRCDRAALTRALFHVWKVANSSRLPEHLLRVSLGPVELGREQPASPNPLDPGQYARLRVIDDGPDPTRASRDQPTEPAVLGPGIEMRNENQSVDVDLVVVSEFLHRHRGGLRVSNKTGSGILIELLIPLDR